MNALRRHEARSRLQALSKGAFFNERIRDDFRSEGPL
jgi:hypothetical protein